MKSNHEFMDSPELDEFFRRGEQPDIASESIHPVVDESRPEEEMSRVFVRTPEQAARRAKYIRLVSVAMACLTVSSALVLSYKALSSRHALETARADTRISTRALQPAPASVQIASVAASRVSERALSARAAQVPVQAPLEPIADAKPLAPAQVPSSLDVPMVDTSAVAMAAATGITQKSPADQQKGKDLVAAVASGSPLPNAGVASTNASAPSASMPSASMPSAIAPDVKVAVADGEPKTSVASPVAAEVPMAKIPTSSSARPSAIAVTSAKSSLPVTAVVAEKPVVPATTGKTATAIQPKSAPKLEKAQARAAQVPRTFARREKPVPASVSASKPAAVKPDSYRPPTASFSD